jgi:succinate dehydrogenase / fumarate reductase flavoprotein subunit
MASKFKNVIVVGGGLAGLSATMRLAENGYKVKLFSLTKVKRSHSVCAQGGINAAINEKKEHDSPLLHAFDTIKGGDFLANQPPVIELCMTAPLIIEMMSRFGCPFNRTVEGSLEFRRFGGTLYSRTAFCGSSTGQQLLYALDEQVRRFEVKGMVEKFENHEFLRLVTDDEGRARGIVFQDLFNLKISSTYGDAVVIATGGLGFLFKKSTNSTFCTGAANARLYKMGMKYANGEFVQIHPTSIPGEDKMRLMSESLRGEGGRIWVFGDSSKKMKNPKGELVSCGQTGMPWYFLEEFYPKYGNLVPRDIAAREILRVCELGLGVDGLSAVNLDVTHLSNDKKMKLNSVLDIYEKFTGQDPRIVPMRIFPAVHYTMGGAWVDYPAANDQDWGSRYRHMTNIKGLFNCGESDYQYHGANRLGANALLACIFSGLVVGNDVPRYVDTLDKLTSDVNAPCFKAALEKEESLKKNIFSFDGEENVFLLHKELSEYLVNNVTVKRNNHDLSLTLQKIFEIKGRFKNITLNDGSKIANQSYIFANQFYSMIDLALVITKGALLRNEFRGCHYKPEYPERDDKNFLKTTIATFSEDGPQITYEDVDVRHLKPFKRDYINDPDSSLKIENVPINPPLPL